MCSAFSQLQKMNVNRMGPNKYEQMIKNGVDHLRFCIKLYKMQMENGLYFLHEHPAAADSWNDIAVKNLLGDPRVMRVVGDMCTFGMSQDVGGEDRLVRKPTGFMTNANVVAEELGKRCPRIHFHIYSLNGRANRAEVYPDELWHRVLIGSRILR